MEDHLGSSSPDDATPSISNRNSILLFLRDLILREENLQEETTDLHESIQNTQNSNNIRFLRNSVRTRSLRRGSNAEENKIDEATLRRIRRRRLNFLNDQGESNDELINPSIEEEYIDFRIYPFTIDWKDIENDDSILFEILQNYGYFGVVCFSKLNRMKIIKINENLLKCIIDYLSILANDENNMNSIQILEIFMLNLPELDKILEVLSLNLVTSKELVLLKVVLDIHEFYFRFKLLLKPEEINLYFSVNSLFYSSLSEDEVTNIYKSLRTNKDLYDIMKNKLHFPIFKKKENYLKNLSKSKIKINSLLGGLNEKDFIL